MKRASLNLNRSRAVDQKARARAKHQTLLQEYLDLQKEFVSKKRKLQTTKQKRETLFAEIRFLKRRHKCLLKNQSLELKQEKVLVRSQNPNIESNIPESSINAVEAELQNPCPVLVSNSNLRDEQVGAGGGRVVRKELRVGKKRKSYLIDDKRVRKRELSWQGSLTLKV